MLPVVMVVVMVVIVGFVLILVRVIVYMVRVGGLRLVAVSNQPDAEYARHDGGDETDHRSNDGNYRPKERVGYENGVGTRLGGRKMRKDRHDERDAPLRRISATTGTTEQLQSGIGTPMAALVATDFNPSSRNHRSIAWREMNTCIRPERKRPSSSIGASSRKDDHRKSRNATRGSASPIASTRYRLRHGKSGALGRRQDSSGEPVVGA